jgi:hypothetical protein
MNLTSYNYSPKNSDFDPIARRLRECNGVAVFRMRELRKAIGAGKLGHYVCAALKKELRRRGISFLPELGTSQDDLVLLYETDSSGGRLLLDALSEGTRQESAAPVSQSPENEQDRNPELEATASDSCLTDVIRILDAAESEKHFVSLRWFRDVALSAATPTWTHDAARRDAALRAAIQRDVVRTSKVHNPKNPQHPTTSIRLNRTAPEVQAALRSANGSGGAGRGGFRPTEIRNGPLSATVLRDRR